LTGRKPAVALDVALRAARGLQETLSAILDAVQRVPGVERTGICLPSGSDGEMRPAMQRGLAPHEAVDCPCLPADDPLVGRARAGEPVFWSVPAGEAPAMRDCPILGLGGAAILPIQAGEQLVGLLLAGTSRPGGFAHDSRKALLVIGSQAATNLRAARTENETFASEERYRALIEQSSDGIFAFHPVTHRVVEANLRFRQMLGYDEREILSLTLDEVIAASPESIVANVAEVMGQDRHHIDERKYRRKDGQLLDVEVSLSRARYDLTDVVLVNVRDISRRKANEVTLASVRYRHQLILDAAGEGILGLDREGRHTFVNPAAAELLGYATSEMLGVSSHSLWHHTKRDGSAYPETECPIYAAIHDGRVHRSDQELFWRKDGSSVPVEYVSTPIMERDEVVGSVVVFRDISKVARLEAIAEAIEAMNSIGYVFSAVRHELGNPVNSVKMALSVLRNNLASFQEDAIRTYLDRSLDELSRVEDLLASLKSFSLYENVRAQQMDLSEFLSQFLSLVRPDFSERGITLLFRPSPDAQRVFADPRALRHILLNLFANAADALVDHLTPAITLRTYAKPGLTEIRVEDNGSGIPEAVRKEIFQPFWTTKANGTGLGLVIVKKMMAKMEGTIEIESWTGAGTTVILTLPADGASAR
jgi:PAS domain S-box-containing protein